MSLKRLFTLVVPLFVLGVYIWIYFQINMKIFIPAAIRHHHMLSSGAVLDSGFELAAVQAFGLLFLVTVVTVFLPDAMLRLFCCRYGDHDMKS